MDKDRLDACYRAMMTAEDKEIADAAWLELRRAFAVGLLRAGKVEKSAKEEGTNG